MPQSKLKIENGKWKISQTPLLNFQLSTLNSQFKKGFSLIDVLLTTLLVIMFSSILLVGSGSFLTSRKSSLRSVATKIASEQIDSLRNLDFATLIIQPSPDNFSHEDLSKLPSGASGTQTIELNPPSNYPDMRLVTTKVTWTEDGEAKSVQMQTLIYENGL